MEGETGQQEGLLGGGGKSYIFLKECIKVSIRKT